MRLIDADVLLDNIRRDSKKAIDEGDKVGSFWLGYIAGLVIKQPTIQSALDPETLIRTIETGITATNSNDAYSLGMRNGMRWCKSLIDGAEPKFEDDVMSVDDGKKFPTIQPEKAQLSKEGTTFDTISRQAAIDTVDSEVVSTNPEHFKSSEKFIKFMDDADIASFGKWQWANGFNTALVASKVKLEKLPTSQPEPQWIPVSERLPETGVEVLTYDEALNYIEIQTVSDGRWGNQRGDWQDLDDIAAWMPLPTPYTK